jgi:tRNA (cytidine/uridine-2'-O-)-methyltransferase
LSFVNIVLFQPEIPQNTGNIARMCVANDLKLHLIKPLGFEITDKHLKRSGLDYWQYLDYLVYENWEEFLSHVNKSRIWFLTTKAEKSFWEVEFKQGDYLVFGPETKGLPEDLMRQDWNQAIKVPMRGKHARSLNLASTAQTVYYEAFRQLSVSSDS